MCSNALLLGFFLSAWLLMAIGLVIFYYFNKNLSHKQKLHPWIMSCVALLLIVFLVVLQLPPRILVILMPLIAIIFFLNIIMTKFCQGCGQTIFNREIISKYKFCPYCGCELEMKKVESQQAK